MPLAKAPLIAIAVVLVALLAGCGSSNEPSIPVSGRLVGASATSPGRVVLSPLGAQRIGLQTAAVRSARKPASEVIIPYSAIVYDPSGKSYAFTNTAPLTYQEVRITIDRISGGSAYLTAGPKPRAKVVTVGAEELYGVQTGVLAQT